MALVVLMESFGGESRGGAAVVELNCMQTSTGIRGDGTSPCTSPLPTPQIPEYFTISPKTARNGAGGRLYS